eukprot:COSAG05_NODE_1667_length_4310_cov_3.574210_3_plen_107_part_00
MRRVVDLSLSFDPMMLLSSADSMRHTPAPAPEPELQPPSLDSRAATGAAGTGPDRGSRFFADSDRRIAALEEALAAVLQGAAATQRELGTVFSLLRSIHTHTKTVK